MSLSCALLSRSEAPIIELKASELGELACWSLEQEALLSPKPGLVDKRGQGCHGDMDLSLMLASAHCLGPYFTKMASAAMTSIDDQSLRCELGHLGRQAETEMLKITGGVNTHKGAIWSLGLLVGAAAKAPQSANQLVQRAGALARMHDSFTLMSQNKTKGQTVCDTYKVPGAREQAQLGFPQLQYFGLPILQQSRARGDRETQARLNALLGIMSALTDTCVLSRSGLRGLTSMQQGAKAVLNHGGCGTLAGQRQLKALDDKLLTLNASPGGAADLLGATLFVDSLFAPLPPLANQVGTHYGNSAL